MRVAAALVLIVVGVASCAAAALHKPETPMIRCLPIGAVPDSKAWIYVCTFPGDTVPPPTTEGQTAGVSL